MMERQYSPCTLPIYNYLIKSLHAGIEYCRRRIREYKGNMTDNSFVILLNCIEEMQKRMSKYRDEEKPNIEVYILYQKAENVYTKVFSNTIAVRTMIYDTNELLKSFADMCCNAYSQYGETDIPSIKHGDIVGIGEAFFVCNVSNGKTSFHFVTDDITIL